MSLKRATLTAAAVFALCAACAPTVPTDLPKAKLEINMNAKISPEVRESVDKDLDRLFSDEKEIF